jgi:hypothetical protein
MSELSRRSAPPTPSRPQPPGLTGDKATPQLAKAFISTRGVTHTPQNTSYLPLCDCYYSALHGGQGGASSTTR